MSIIYRTSELAFRNRKLALKFALQKRHLHTSKPLSNYYDTLGITKDATEEEIKKAYKDLAKKYHPDRPEGNEEIFIRVKDAHETLSNTSKR